MKRFPSKDKGTPSQLLSALEGKIAQLEGSEVESATEVIASKKSFSHGTPSQLLSMLDNKISELEDTNIESSTSVMAEIDADDAFGLDRYIHNLIGSVNEAISANELFSGHTWDVSDDKSQIYLTVVDGDSSQEFAIPVEDLSRDFDSIDEDVDYIMNAIMPAESNGNQANVSSSSTVEATRDWYYGKEQADEFGDAILSKLKGKTVSKRRDTAEAPGGLIYEAKKLGIDMWDLLAALEGLCYQGKAQEIDDSTYKILGSSSAVKAAWPFDYEDEDSESEWVKERTKRVMDRDGFWTDYTMYRNSEDGSYIFMFGDADIYEPDRAYADYETDSEDVANEWFDAYEGFGDEDDEGFADEDTYSGSDTDPQISTYSGFEDYLTRSIESGMIDYAEVPPEDYDEEFDYSDEYEAFFEMCESFDRAYRRKFKGKPYTISDPDEASDENGAFAIVTVDGVDYELEGQGNMWRFNKR